jgi:hypothetical protein
LGKAGCTWAGVWRFGKKGILSRRQNQNQEGHGEDQDCASRQALRYEPEAEPTIGMAAKPLVSISFSVALRDSHCVSVKKDYCELHRSGPLASGHSPLMGSPNPANAAASASPATDSNTTFSVLKSIHPDSVAG